MNARQLDKLLLGFARDNLLVASKDGGFTPLVFNSIQEDRWEQQLSTHKTRFIDLKARQVGLTTYHVAKHLLRLHLIAGHTAMSVAQGDDTAEDLRKVVLGIIDRMPTTRGLPRLTSRSSPLTWDNGSRYLFGSSESKQGYGRGTTIHSLHCTEFAKWADPATTLAAIQPAVPVDGEIAIESTPLGFGTFRDRCLDARTNPESPWHFSFFEWFKNPEYRLPAPADFTPTQEERHLLQSHPEITPEQLMFRRLQKHDFPTTYLSEYAEDFDTAFMAAGDSRFAPEQILRLSSQCVPAEDADLDGLLRIFQPPFANTAYAIGVDTAEGVQNGDHSAAVCIRAGSGAHVATLTDDPPHPSSRERRMSPDLFAARLADLGHRYNDALICVEAMGKSAGAVLYALEYEHHYPNIFHEDTGDFSNPYGKTPGVRMTQEMKSLLVTNFARAIDQHAYLAADARVPQQMADFVVLERTPQGYERLGARKGAHDDLLVATMLGLHAAPAARLSGQRRVFTRVW